MNELIDKKVVRATETKKLINSVKTLETREGIARGTVENSIGVSLGHLSKLLKNEKSISIKHAVALSEYFEVSIDRLINGDFTVKYNKLNLVIEYINKVIEDTECGKIVWTKGKTEEFLSKEKDISKAYLEDFDSKYYFSMNTNPRELINCYYRGKCRDRTAILLTYSKDIVKESNVGWDYNVLTWKCEDTQQYYEDAYEVDEVLTIYATHINKWNELLVKTEELVECIEKCMKDIPVSIEAQMEIDAFLSE